MSTCENVDDMVSLQEWTQNRKAQYGSVNKLSQVLGVSRKTVTDWLNGEVGALTEKGLQAIASLEKITTEEVRHKFGLPDMSAYQARRSPHVKETPESEVVYIPLYSIAAGAGNGANPEGDLSNMISFPREWLRNTLRVNPEYIEAILVVGDSMEPSLNAGDMVLIDRSDKHLRDGVYVLRMDGDLFIKRLSRMPETKMLVSSDNPIYEKFTIDLERPPTDFEVIGKVVWVGHKI